MSWLAEAEANKLMMTLLTMRHHEAEYRVNRTEVTRQQFPGAYHRFIDIFGTIDGTPEMKSKLETEVQLYADTFAQWIEGQRPSANPMRALIDIDSQNMLPRADDHHNFARTVPPNAPRQR